MARRLLAGEREFDSVERSACRSLRTQGFEPDYVSILGAGLDAPAGYAAEELVVLAAADKMDKVGNREARKEIGMIKVAAPNMACKVIDWAIQMHGGGGVSNDFGLSYAYASARTLRLADGPDEVHRDQIARLEMKKYRQ